MIEAGNYDWHKHQMAYSAANGGNTGHMYRHVWAAMHDKA
jgi:hypothetical protein